MNPYAKIRFSMSKNEAAMQKTAITKKIEEKTPKQLKNLKIAIK